MANDINLMPPPDIEKTKQINRKALISGAIAAVLILGGYFGIFIPLEAKRMLVRELNEVKVDEMNYMQTTKTHQDLIAEIDATNMKLMELEGNLPDAFSWAEFLREIEGCMPPDVTFKNYRFEARSLYIIGDYKRDEDIGRLLVKLRELEMIEGARLLSITQNQDRVSYEFEMNCDLAASVYPEVPAQVTDAEGDAGAENTESQEGGQ